MRSKIYSLQQAHSRVFVIVSPPRCSSTALARVFWEHPLIRYYAHEPFESLYYLQKSLDDVFGRLTNPLDLQLLKRGADNCIGNGLVIKEMPYQVGQHFEVLTRLATAPIVFLIRDPRQNIASRMKRKVEVGDSPLFPMIETGWKLLRAHILFCQTAGIPFWVVDSKDFRNRPKSVLRELFARIHLSFSEDMLVWKSQPTVDIDNLDGKHTHLYRKVLRSNGLLPDNDPIPSLDTFPEANGFRQHVADCLNIYRQLRELSQLISPGETVKSRNGNQAYTRPVA